MSMQDWLTRIESARLSYKPEVIRRLFIAEAPPPEESGRFFYFEDVKSHDSLFLEIMKVLYPEEDHTVVRSVRARKAEFLRRFMDDGCYLIDACEEPMTKRSRTWKEARIRDNLPGLLSRMRELVTPGTPVILISAPVYSVCFHPLRSNGFRIVNTEMIDFPGSGAQPRFGRKLRQLLGSPALQAANPPTQAKNAAAE